MSRYFCLLFEVGAHKSVVLSGGQVDGTSLTRLLQSTHTGISTPTLRAPAHTAGRGRVDMGL